MRTSDVLNKAADLIETHGWGRGGSTWDPDCDAGLCVEGGIIAALGMDASNIDRIYDDLTSCPAYAAVREYLTERGEDLGDDWLLWRWNDRQLEGGPVVEVLRATAVIEAAKEDDAIAAEFLTWQGSEISA